MSAAKRGAADADDEHKTISRRLSKDLGPWIYRNVFYDAWWAFGEGSSEPFGALPDKEAMVEAVLTTPRVRTALTNWASANHSTVAAGERLAAEMLTQLSASASQYVLRMLAYLLRKVWRQLYSAITFDIKGLERVVECSKKGPLVLVPSHKSHIDYLMISYIFFSERLQLPFIAAGDNLRIPIVGWLLSQCGAFFMRRSFHDDPLYTAVFNEYVHYLVEEQRPIEFFIEGGRSRSGKLLPPKFGLLSIVLESVVQDRTDELFIVPISIGYDKVLEGGSFASELLGGRKKKETLGGLIRESASLLGKSYGRVNVEFAQPISVREYLNEQLARHGAGFDPKNKDEDFRVLVDALGYRVVYDISHASLAMPTSLVATILLTHIGRGLTLSELAEKVDWLRPEILRRGAPVATTGDTREIVEKSLRVLSSMVKRPADVVEPLIRARDSRRIELSFYKNQIIFVFVPEALIAAGVAANNGCLPPRTSSAIDAAKVSADVRFLSQIFKKEFTFKTSSSGFQDNFERTLQLMDDRSILSRGSEGAIRLHSDRKAEPMFVFLHQILAPFLDGYWVSAFCLLTLLPDRLVLDAHLIALMQMVAQSLYHEGLVRHSDAVAKETLQNSLAVYTSLGLVQVKRVRVGKSNAKLVQVHPDYREGDKLKAFVNRLFRFRADPPPLSDKAQDRLVKAARVKSLTMVTKL